MLKRFFSIQCHAWGLTDVGLNRSHNEDTILLNPQHNLYLLADGMGGHQAGEVASKLAVTAIDDLLFHTSNELIKTEIPENSHSDFPQIDQITAAISAANKRIHKENQVRGLVESKGMGTTVVGCWFLAEQKTCLIFHVGDSRAYSYRKNTLHQITRDHSLFELWKENGMQGEKPPSNVLAQALGPYNTVTPDISVYPVTKGEKILLCSDGLSNMISDDEICDILSQQNNFPEQIPQCLIDQANTAGGLDNISVILITFS